MAVYTPLTPEQISDFLAHYELGEYAAHEEIAQGVTNSNFHLFTDQGRYILTLFEERWGAMEHLSYYFSLADHLNKRGMPCPHAYPDKEGQLTRSLAGKKAVIVSYLAGETIGLKDITPAHCKAIGGVLARMHIGAMDFPDRLANPTGLAFWHDIARKTAGQANTFENGLQDFIARELFYLEENWPKDLPQGAIHSDLFPDNVLFQGAMVSGVIDFYLSCNDFYAYDLAIVINAWCFDEKQEFCPAHFRELLDAYQAVRPLRDDEQEAMPVILRGAAMRFLVSRLHDVFFYNPDSNVTPHDPGEYIAKLKFHQKEQIFGC